MAVYRLTNGNDTKTGTTLNDWLYGLLGNDTLYGNAGNDYLSGGVGNDKLYGGAGEDALWGGAGTDYLYGDDGHDYLDGGRDTVRDYLNGGTGNDEVTAYANDSALGGAGSDSLAIGLDFSTTATKFTIDLSKINGSTAVPTGYKGIVAGQFENANVFISNAAAGSSLVGTMGDDVIHFGSSSTGGVSINGGAGSDQIAGGAGADTLTGGSGSDLFDVLSVIPSGPYPGTPDTIKDFGASDYFLISTQYMGGYDPWKISTVNPNDIVISGSNPVANRAATAVFLYDTDDGKLYYDADGTGSGVKQHIFTLSTKPALAETNFILDI